MVSKILSYIIDKRIESMYKKKGLYKCHNQRCFKPLKIGDCVISRMVSSGYCRFPKGCFIKRQKTRRVLYHLKCAMELNII